MTYFLISYYFSLPIKFYYCPMLLQVNRGSMTQMSNPKHSCDLHIHFYACPKLTDPAATTNKTSLFTARKTSVHPAEYHEIYKEINKDISLVSCSFKRGSHQLSSIFITDEEGSKQTDVQKQKDEARKTRKCFGEELVHLMDCLGLVL